MKRIFALLLTLMMLLSLAACSDKDDDKTPSGSSTPPSSGQQTQQPSNTPGPGTTQTENEKAPEKTAEEIASGFGSYNGQPIVWRVLDIDIANERALLISKVILADKVFHEGDPVSAYWETSSLREWLNGEFLNTSFTGEEAARIVDAEITIENNSEYGTPGGNSTIDKVFLLSEEEANRYFADEEDRRSNSLVPGEEFEDWWLRTSGEDEEHAAVVFATGSIYTDGFTKGFDEIGVRPAIWVNLSDEADAADPGNDDSQPSGGDMADWNYTDYAENTNGVPEPEFAYTVKGIINNALTLNSEASADEINVWKQTLLDNGAEEVREGDTWAVRDGAHLIEMNGILNGVARIYISLDDTPVSGDGQPEQSDTPDPGTTQTENNNDVEIKGEAWPENEFTALVPKPRNGVVDAENSTQFGCMISLVMTEEEVAEYAADLIAAGFEGEWNDSAKMYYGKNSEGYKVSLMYNGPTTIFSISKE